MVYAFPSCSIDPAGPDCVRALALATLKVLQGGSPVSEREAHLVDFIADRDDRDLRMLLDVSLPAIALAGHDDLSDAIRRALHGADAAARAWP